MRIKAKSAEFATEIILHLARLAHGEGGHSCGLTGAQWAALRYFARANRSSRTLLAFADYHVTTRGTASQTVKKLVAKGLLTRRPSKRDGRSSQIDLTDQARVLFEDDPSEALAGAIADLDPKLGADLAALLEQVMGRIVADRQRCRFGTCPTCFHLTASVTQEVTEASYMCRLTGLQMQHSEIDQICINYNPDTTQ